MSSETYDKVSDFSNLPANLPVALLLLLGCGPGKQGAKLSPRNPSTSKSASCPSTILFPLLSDFFF